MELLGSSLIILAIVVGSFIVGSIVGAIVSGREVKRDREDIDHQRWHLNKDIENDEEN